MTTILNKIELPDTFTQKITHSFQHKGEEWLQQLPQLVETCVKRWHLSNLTLSPELFYSLVLFGRQPENGEVVLKIGVPHQELYSQIHSIQLFQGHGLCRCFALDEALGAMLLERILPGENLWTVHDPVERCQIVADLYRQMIVYPPVGHRLPLFRDRIQNAVQRSENVPDSPAFLTKSLHQAAVDYLKLEAENGAPMLLHCDLNHGNILRDHQVWDANHGRRVTPGWRAIDPNGFVGARPLECARFIENEMRVTPAEDQMPALRRMIALFADILGCSQHAVAQGVMIDNILNTFLCIEFHTPEEWIESGLAACGLFQQSLDAGF